MATDKNASAFTTKCSVCAEKFANIQECLKHELIKHSLQKKSSPQNRVQKRLNATAKFLNADEKLMEHERLKQQLKKCKSGQELSIIFELFCMKTDNLDLIFTRIQTCLEKELRSAGIVRIYPFGSIASGLALRDCDIDIFLDVSNLLTSPVHKRHNENNNDKSHHRKAFNRITSLLNRSTHFTDVFPIRRARVPIIKCKHEDTGFSIDINVSYPSSRENTQFIFDLVKSDKRIHELMLFLKLWAKNMQIISRDNMTSYCLITMVTFFLQQPQRSVIQMDDANNDKRILKSIKELQENCPFHMVQGVNYAYDLRSEENKPKISAEVTTWDLIKNFFDFYQNLDFENHVISPYYGRLVSKTNLISDTCEEYQQQLSTITQYLQGEPANNLQTDRCMCVQDAFCLNQNVAKNISPQNRDYILLCLQNAKKLCENPHKLKLTQLYEQLLFETIKVNTNETKEKVKAEIIADLKNLKLPTVESIDNANNNNVKLTYTIKPSKGDLRTVVAHYPALTAADEILCCWCQHYVDTIATIITKLYRMDMQKQQPTKQKQQKLEKKGTGLELNQSWLISCTIDLWSSRCFQKNLQTTFMSYQLQQTERLHNLRRQDPKYSVTLNGILDLHVLPNYMGIGIQLRLEEGCSASSLTKKSPLRKFFNVFKNTLNCFAFKDICGSADNVITTLKKNKF